MSSISVRIPDRLLSEVDEHAKELQMSRALYLREALERMNASVRSERRRARLMELSRRVREESARVNEEFSEIDHDPAA
ncbi:MAG: ribbon-helix-helix protein, CopG family [Deltaproteobacteria bacterium]|nr:ribbon-helix-helix protein, CopG family [Deltaproteobacteria bacterium]